MKSGGRQATREQFKTKSLDICDHETAILTDCLERTAGPQHLAHVIEQIEKHAQPDQATVGGDGRPVAPG